MLGQKEGATLLTVAQKLLQDLRTRRQSLLQAAVVGGREELRCQGVEGPAGVLLEDEITDLVPDWHLVATSGQRAANLVLRQGLSRLPRLRPVRGRRPR